MNARILIIEDDEAMRRNIATILRMEGYETFEAANGKDGLRLGHEKFPDIILCDILMPDMNGLAVLRELRGNSDTLRTAFIFLTSRGERSDIRAGMTSGADDYLCKPFEAEELLEAVASRLQRLTELSKPPEKAEPTPDMLLELGLTGREAETLFWVAQGKSNADLCILLEVKLTTIKKHLESIYLKLGVENRTAAAAMALELLNQ